MKKLTIGIILLLASFAASAGFITTLLLNASTTGAGTGVNYSSFTSQIPIYQKYFMATLSGASAVSATVEIDASTDNVNWSPLTTLSLTAASSVVSTQQVISAPYIRGNITAISGVGATVTLRSGI